MRSKKKALVCGVLAIAICSTVVIWVLGSLSVPYEETSVEVLFQKAIEGTATDDDYDKLRTFWRSCDGEFALHFYGQAYVAFGTHPKVIDRFSNDARFGQEFISKTMKNGPGCSSDLGMLEPSKLQSTSAAISNHLATATASPQTNYLNDLAYGLNGYLESP